MRVQMAALDWNENVPDRFRIGLERREAPKKGKKARGRNRSMPLEEHLVSGDAPLLAKVEAKLQQLSMAQSSIRKNLRE